MSHLKGKRVLVTGAGGSIGTELVCQLLLEGPREMALLDISEYNLYQLERRVEAVIQSEGLGDKAPDLKFMLADIRHAALVEAVFNEERPEYVFHAAALKHVPMLEHKHNIIEAIRTNVLGTKAVLDAAIWYGAEQFVLVSTDKAVNPVSIMGTTKTFAEGVCYEATANVSGTDVVTVRFGNVVGSSGSVVPLFKQQIANGGPVTVTHPDIVRYMMSLDEAVRLVLDASKMGVATKLHHTYVLDMGAPINIDQLARRLIHESGKDVPVQYIGLRPGEKMYEELYQPWERSRDTRIERVKSALVVGRPPEYRYALRVLEQACERRDLGSALHALKHTVGYEGDTVLCSSL